LYLLGAVLAPWLHRPVGVIDTFWRYHWSLHPNGEEVSLCASVYDAVCHRLSLLAGTFPKVQRVISYACDWLYDTPVKPSTRVYSQLRLLAWLLRPQHEMRLPNDDAVHGDYVALDVAYVATKVETKTVTKVEY
jgi:hypothetical protein